MSLTTRKIAFASPRVLSELYANRPQNLQRTEALLGVKLVSRDNWIEVTAEPEKIDKVESLFNGLNQARAQGLVIRGADFERYLQAIASGKSEELRSLFAKPLLMMVHHRRILPKTPNQKRYLEAISTHDIVFGIGPAGTGKTYLAVAAALQALFEEKVDRIILTRPAVESGEALGFLPGDLEEKILPYLRPFYDAMGEIIGPEETRKLIENGLIEIAPLAYMRGRTLSRAFIVLDEAQNTTHEQMMMFLTRLGERSSMVITGDITQVDLPNHKTSGLKEAARALQNVEGVAFFNFEAIDVVRHPLVQRIVEAYGSFMQKG
jgi:phosphate starvation-inducible protein PhoH and related proteins